MGSFLPATLLPPLTSPGVAITNHPTAPSTPRNPRPIGGRILSWRADCCRSHQFSLITVPRQSLFTRHLLPVDTTFQIYHVVIPDNSLVYADRCKFYFSLQTVFFPSLLKENKTRTPVSLSSYRQEHLTISWHQYLTEALESLRHHVRNWIQK